MSNRVSMVAAGLTLAALTAAVVWVVAPAIADKGGCPDAAASNGAAHANSNSAFGSEKQAARGCANAVSPASNSAKPALKQGEIEPSEGPEATDAPEPTDRPEATEAPEPTEQPEATEAPEPSEAPEVTEAPEASESPEATDVPESRDDDVAPEVAR